MLLLAIAEPALQTAAVLLGLAAAAGYVQNCWRKEQGDGRKRECLNKEWGRLDTC